MRFLPLSNKTWTALTVAAACLFAATPILADGTTGATTPATSVGTTQATTQTTAQTTQSSTQTAVQAGDTLTLSQAIDQALKSNYDLRMKRLDVDTANLNSSSVTSRIKDISVEDIDSLDAAKSKFSSQASADLSKKINALSLKSAESQTRLQVQKLYYACINADAEMKLQEQSLQRTQTNLEMVKAKLAAGTVPKTDVTSAEVGLANAKVSLANAKNNLRMAQLNLSKYVGLDLNKQWNLDENTKLVQPTLTTLDEAVAKALKQRYEVEQTAGEEKLAELTVELYDKYSSVLTYAGSMAVNDLNKAKAAIEEKNQTITLEVTQAYYTLQNSQESLESLTKSKELAAENYRAAKIRYENGLATSMEVIQAEEDMTKSENQYNNAVNNYNISVAAFLNAIGE